MGRRAVGTMGGVLVILVLGFLETLNAQVTSSSILGSIFDPHGKPIQGTEVTLTDSQRSFTRQTTTDNLGNYRFIGLAPAVYTLSARAPGFADAKRDRIALLVDSQLKLDFHLQVAGIRQTIEVSAPLQGIQTESSELGAVLDQGLIATLPLNARNFLDLSFLIPGVAPPVQGSALSTRGGFAMHADGGREEYNNFLIDGVDNNDPYVSGYAVESPVDSIQEFKVATNSYSAEYGRGGAGQVNVITRGGTNDFHGSAYEYLRNSVLDARNYFDPPDKPGFIRNQFGATAGGPIRKDHTFFFANIEFLRERGPGISQLATVPTEADRTSIPSSLISPIAQDILALYPPPNLPGTVNNYLGETMPVTNETRGSFRIDHQLNANDYLTLRYSLGKAYLFESYAECSNCLPGFGDYVNDFTQNAMIQYRHLFGPRTISTLSLGFNRFSRDIVAQNNGVNVGQSWNVDWLNVPPRDYGYPSIIVAGYSQIGDVPSLPDLRHTNTYQITEGLTLDRGAHLLKLGGEVRVLQLNSTLDLYARGLLDFSGYITGSGISDLLLGLPTFTMISEANNPIIMRSTSYAGYIQDAWKLRRNLVLNLGLRYEYNSPPVSPNNGMSELNLTTGQIEQVGTGGVTRSGFRPDRTNFAPRVGIAWSPARDFVARAGYGISYDAGMFEAYSAAFFNPPQFTLQQYYTSASAPLTLQNPFPASANVPAPATLSVLSPNLVTPYLQSWNLTLEKALGKIGTLTISYAGSKGTHLLSASDLNQPSPAPGNFQLSRPYPQYANIFYVQSEAASSYNALQVHFYKRLSSGISVWVAYTYSHSLDNASAFLPTTADPNFPQNSHNLAAEWASSSFDIRQHLAMAYVLTLPRGNRWTRNTEFQGIVNMYSGQPFTPMLLEDNSNTGNGSDGSENGSDRPNIVGNPTLANPTPQEWFNTSAFAIPAPYTFGNAGRNCLRGPGFATFDVSLLRTFSLTERNKLTLEAQAFNLFNRVNFNLPQAYADQPDFGTITSAKAPRQLQIAARIRF